MKNIRDKPVVQLNQVILQRSQAVQVLQAVQGSPEINRNPRNSKKFQKQSNKFRIHHEELRGKEDYHKKKEHAVQWNHGITEISQACSHVIPECPDILRSQENS